MPRLCKYFAIVTTSLRLELFSILLTVPFSMWLEYYKYVLQKILHTLAMNKNYRFTRDPYEPHLFYDSIIFYEDIISLR